MKHLILSTLVLFASFNGIAQDSDSPFVNYDQFEALVKEVKEHRKDRLVGIEKFNEMSTMENVFILDTRSKEMYDKKHVKGAIHLNFSDFTQKNLDNLFGSRDVTVLIYCNNNFIENTSLTLEEKENPVEEFFPTKMSMPVVDLTELKLEESSISSEGTETNDELPEIAVEEVPITLALNIPTYINLFGYGYKNVYELKDLINVNDERIEFEGTAVIAGL